MNVVVVLDLGDRWDSAIMNSEDELNFVWHTESLPLNILY